MPISLPPLSPGPLGARTTRRRFLGVSLAAAAGWVLRPTAASALWGAESPTTRKGTDPDRFALLSDIHIAADPEVNGRGVNMFDNLKRVCGDVLGAEQLPAAVFIDGDLAFQSGEAGDYATVVESLKPLREAGLPIHLALGNHDDREHFWKGLPAEDEARHVAKNRPVDGRQAMVVESARANWFVLDSLERTTATPGRVGPEQLKWLSGALDERRDKPALVMVHHDPTHASSSGLRDTADLMDVLKPRQHVKALLFGHTHDWEVSRQDGIHLVNFPPVAYVFTAGKPSGWVEATLADKGMTLQLHCLDPKHPQDGQRLQLEWRT